MSWLGVLAHKYGPMVGLLRHIMDSYGSCGPGRGRSSGGRAWWRRDDVKDALEVLAIHLRRE
jgi:hypothetical protein